jgi:phage-related minor tail protein
MGEYIKRGVGMAIGGDIWDTAKENFKEVISFGSDWQKSLNTLQAQTGATGEEMDKLSQAMTNVYGNNFGSSMEDVAESMMEVRTYLQGTGEDIQSATQNAIAFRDTFGVEVPESMRSVQALIKQFGLTSEEAFNLLAQGEQNGLNYSDELFDSVDEYSVQFDKLGLSATDMFNVFKSGADAGAFNLDKIGDAVKEFSIRAIDGSKTTQQGFEALGFNADEMAQKFAAGGDTAKEAFNQVIAGLRNMNDPVAQSTAGVDLFGTMWEDLGPQVVTSLDSVQGAFDQTKNSMEQINQIKYNDPISALEGMGRQIQTSILLPISKDVLPSLNNMANPIFMKKHQ